MDYWQRVASNRFSRRATLRTGALGVGAVAFLAACGGGSDKKVEDVTKIVAEPQDTLSKATKGGVYQTVDSNNIQSLEPFLGGFEATQNMATYSRIVKFETAKYPKPSAQVYAPDIALSWEMSPDGMTHTYKLRPNMKWDARPPTGGRALTSADLKYTFDRFNATSPNGSQLMNAKDPTAPVASWSAVDPLTFQIKTSFPYAPLNGFLANFRFVAVIPTEAYEKYDPRTDMRGTGAWLLKDFKSGSRIEFTKNPDWYDAAKVNLDGITYNSIQEYATGVSQFRAGNLWTYALSQEDVLPTKQSLPQLLMTRQEDFPISYSWLRMGYNQGSPFRDERVRQALSMLIDRDLFVNTFGNVDTFTKAGVEVKTRWHTAVPCGENDYWLDPKNAKDFGENAKYYQLNAAEAKKLVRAAGLGDTIESKFTYRPDNTPEFIKMGQVIVGMWEAQNDFKFKINVVDNRSDFQPNYTNNMNKHDGIAYNVAAAPPDVDSFLYTYYKSGLVRTGHVDGNGQPDAKLDDYLAKQRAEADVSKRAVILKDMQRYAAQKQYLLGVPGAALGFNLAQPFVGNWGVYRSRAGGSVAQEQITYNWYDQSKKA
jgi:ABC-type transport system substrate-binding protein